MTLANSGLIDTRQMNRTVELATSDYRYICENKEERQSRYRASGTSAKAKYKAFSANYGRSTSDQESTESINAMCDIGDKKFSEFVQENYAESLGSNLAGEITKCVAILASAGREALLGTVRVLQGDEIFLLEINHSQGKPEDSYTVDHLAAPDSITCDGLDKLQIQGNNTIRCKKPKGVAAEGALVLKPKVKKETVSLRFTAASLDAEEAITLRIQREHHRLDKEYRAALASSEKSLLDKIDALTKRKPSLTCNQYARGRGYGGVQEFSNYVMCGKQDERVVDCWFGSQHSTHNKVFENGFWGCRSQVAQTDWATALCCKVDLAP